jgi:hypothetical protein
MSSHVVPIAEMSSLPWCDSSVTSFAWVNGNRDLRLCVERQDGRGMVFEFQWVDRLRIDLTYGERTNFAPLAFAVEFGQQPDGRGTAAFDFGPNGTMSFDFESITAEAE